MAELFDIHPQNPQARLIRQAVALLDKGGVLAVPTDSSYALVCHIDDKTAADRLRQIRQIDDKHLLALICRDLSELSSYARVDNRQYRMLKLGTPGPFTFILEASKEVPRRLSHPSRKTIGLRVPEHAVLQALLAEHNGPLLSSTLMHPETQEPLHDISEVRELLERQVAGIIDSGACPHQPTTVVDLTPMQNGHAAELIRLGAGNPAQLGL